MFEALSAVRKLSFSSLIISRTVVLVHRLKKKGESKGSNFTFLFLNYLLCFKK